MGQDESLLEVLRGYMAEAGYSPRGLAEATAARWPHAPVPHKTIDHWWHGRASRVHDETDLLKIAVTLGLNKARASRLLRAAGKPSLDALLARPADPERAALLAPWRFIAPHTFPAPLAAFVGRQDEVLAAAELLSSPHVRLLTLTGPGGVGKTRLALEIARTLLDTFPGGIFFVPLETLTADEEILAAIARAVRLPPGDAAAVAERLVARLQGRPTLFLLDNAEHFPTAGLQLFPLLEHASCVKALVTSRVLLRVRGEHEWRVSPLALPGAGLDLRALRAAPAIALFIARAREREPRFALTRENAAAVVVLCTRLEGLPLALELAAARVGEGSPEELLASYTSALDLAADDLLDVPSRQRSLRQTLAWGYGLLSPAQRRLFRALAVFAGGCTVPAATAVVGDDSAPPGATADGLAGLRDASLLERGPGASETVRYSMHTIIREYALEQIREAGEEEVLALRHCDWCIALAERVAAPLDGGPEGRAWLTVIGVEEANLRAALAWAHDHDPERGLRLAGALWPAWFARFGHADGRRWLRRCLDAAPDSSPWCARALQGLGFLALFDDLPAARAHLAGALALAEGTDDTARVAALHWQLAFACVTGGAPDEAAAHLTAGLALLGGDPPPGMRGPYGIVRGFVALARGDTAGAEAALVAADAAVQAAEQPLFRCIVLARLGALRLRRGQLTEAAAAFAALVELAEGVESWFYRFVGRSCLGQVREWAGALDAAEAEYASALALSIAAGGDRLERAMILLGQGRIALQRGEATLALVTLEECAALVAALDHSTLRRELALPLGLARWHGGDRACAAVQLAAALDLHIDGDTPNLARSLEALAGLAVANGSVANAAYWLGAATALRERARVPLRPVETPGTEYTRAAIRAALDHTSADAAEATGRALTPSEAVASARAWLAAR